jgi:hypothetical protein
MSKIRAWWEQQPQGIRAVSLLCATVLLIICIAEWLARPHDASEMVTVKLSNGQTLRLTPGEARDMYIAGGSVPWGFTHNPNPPEPGMPAIPPRSR